MTPLKPNRTATTGVGRRMVKRIVIAPKYSLTLILFAFIGCMIVIQTYLTPLLFFTENLEATTTATDTNATNRKNQNHSSSSSTTTSRSQRRSSSDDNQNSHYQSLNRSSFVIDHDHPFLVNIPLYIRSSVDDNGSSDSSNKKTVLITGASGFIGMHLTLRLLSDNYNVIAFDRNMTISSKSNDETTAAKDDKNIDIHSFVKHQRIKLLYDAAVTQQHQEQLILLEGNVCDRELLNKTFYKYNIDTVVHLATTYEEIRNADRDTKTSPRKPFMYPLNNQDCFIDLLEVLKDNKHQQTKLLYASSSQSFGVSYTLPDTSNKDDVISPASQLLLDPHATVLFDGEDNNNQRKAILPTSHELKTFAKDYDNNDDKQMKQPIINATSKYLTRRTNEMIAKAYWNLYNVSSIGIRFTQIYGPYGRTDMNYFTMSNQVWNNNNNHTFSNSGGTSENNNENKNNKNSMMSLMYIDDAIDDIMRLIEKVNNDGLSQQFTTMTANDGDKENRAVVTIVDNGCTQTKHELHTVMQSILLRGDEGNESRSKIITTTYNLEARDNNDDCYLRGNRQTLERGMTKYKKWFDQLPKSKLTKAAATTATSNVSNEKEVMSMQTSATNSLSSKVVKDLCFVSSMFSQDISQTDHLKNISKYQNTINNTGSEDTPFKFYFFTNLKDLTCPGWERIVVDNLPHRRYITQSRWPKFVGWMHPKLQQTCKTILYSDALIPPRDLTLYQWELLTRYAHGTDSGLMQRRSRTVDRNQYTIIEELDSILQRRKDVPENVHASQTWLRNQLDYNETCFTPGYFNMYVIYNPWNENYRELSTTFWIHYSSEEQSWRDQPLWRYLTNKLDIIPETFYNKKVNLGISNFKPWYNSNYGKKHNKKHRYTDSADNNAAPLQ